MDSEKKQRATDVKVGLFVVLGIAATFFSLFLVGQERSLWEKTADMRAQNIRRNMRQQLLDVADVRFGVDQHQQFEHFCAQARCAAVHLSLAFFGRVVDVLRIDRQGLPVVD